MSGSFYLYRMEHTAMTALNVGGEIFLTMTVTLTQGSAYFAKVLSAEWINNMPHINGEIFIDADPRLFRYILNFLRRCTPPIFWNRSEGFDHPLYAALLEEARYFGISNLEEWIVTKKYMDSVSVKQSIEIVDLKNCLRTGLRQHPDDRRERFHPSDYETKGGSVRKRLEVQQWTFTVPVSVCICTYVSDNAETASQDYL